MSTPGDPRMIHPLIQARRNQNLSQAQAAEEVGIGLNTLKRAERGESLSLETCRLLSKYFAKSAEELGLAKEEPLARRGTPQPLQKEAPAIWIASQMHGLPAVPDRLSERELGAWLVVNACHLMPLTEAGLSLESLLDVYPVILKVVQKMPKMTRRRLMQMAAAAFIVGDIPVLSEKFVSAEEKTELCGTLGESIAASWKLFHTAGNAQVLMVGQALLCLVEQNHSVLPHKDRAMFYSAIYDLIGKSYFFQERYEEAVSAHQSAYIAALQAGDPWRITQSLICQADGYQAHGQHVEAIQTLEEALRVLGTPRTEEQLRSKAHLLACWADNAMNLGEDTTVQRQLEASAAYLDGLGPDEEFDHAIWLQLSGKYALKSGDYTTALRHYEEAQAVLPEHWIVRQVLVLLPMMVAYACKRDRDASLATAKKAAATLQVLNAPSLNKQFAESVHRGLLGSFPKDEYVQAFLTDAQQQYPLLPVASGLER